MTTLVDVTMEKDSIDDSQRGHCNQSVTMYSCPHHEVQFGDARDAVGDALEAQRDDEVRARRVSVEPRA